MKDFWKKLIFLGTKLNVLKCFLLRVEREVQFPWEHSFFFVATCSEFHREEPSSQDKLNLQKYCSLQWDSTKQSKDVYQISLSTADLWIHDSTCSTRDRFFIVPENKHFYFHVTRKVELFMLHWFNCLSEVNFYQPF